MSDTNGLPDLATALKLFKDSTDEFAFNNAVQKANDQAAQIRASQDDEAQKRKQLQDLSHQLTLQAAIADKPATTIAAIGKAIAPQAFGTADQAILQGVLTGDEKLAQLGVQAAQLSKVDERQMKAEERAFLKDRDATKAELMKELASTKAEKLSRLPTGESNKLSALKGKVNNWERLIEELKANPNYSSLKYAAPGIGRAAETYDNISDPKWAGWKSEMVNEYFAMRKEITGVAGAEREYKQIEENQPSFKDPVETTLEKMSRVKEAYQAGLNIRLKGLAKSKYDVREWISEETSSKSPSPVNNLQQKDALSHLPPGTKYLGTSLVNGQLKKIYQGPNGGRWMR